MSHLPVGPVHHMRMAVTDVQRSQAFYTEVLGFEVAVDAPPPPGDENHDVLVDSLQGGVILMHQGMFFGLRPVDEERAAAADLRGRRRRLRRSSRLLDGIHDQPLAGRDRFLRVSATPVPRHGTNIAADPVDDDLHRGVGQTRGARSDAWMGIERAR